MRETSYSEFELKETSIKFSGDESAKRIGCVGTLGETKETRIITKKCEGILTKEVVRGAGVKIEMSLHMGYEAYAKSFGMLVEGAKEGVISYGRLSKHEEVCITAKALDENGDVKYKAYPKAIIEDGDTRSIDNGGDEVAEISLSLRCLPDDAGQCMYEALEEDLKDETLKNNWMTKFNPDDCWVTA